MKYRTLGRTGIKVSEISFGTIPILAGSAKLLPDYFNLSDNQAIQVMRYAYKYGCNFYDTAIVPEYGDAEIKLGKFAKDIGRRNIVIASKARAFDGNDMYHAVLESCHNMQTYPDIYFSHQVKAENEEETFRKGGAIDAMVELKKEGKIKHVGVATHEYKTLLRGAKDHRIDVLQGSGNIIERGMLDRIENENDFQKKGLIINKVFGAGILPKHFGVETLINHVLSYPITTALIGLGTMEQVDQAMNSMTLPHRMPYTKAIMTLDKAFDVIPCDRCQKCVCQQGIEIHVLFRQYNYYYLGKDFWALNKLNMNIEWCIEQCQKCTDMICMTTCPKGINISRTIGQIAQFVRRQ